MIDSNNGALFGWNGETLILHFTLQNFYLHLHAFYLFTVRLALLMQLVFSIHERTQLIFGASNLLLILSSSEIEQTF